MGVLNVIEVASVLLLLLINMHLSEAGRVLLDNDENWTMKNRLSSMTESKKGPTPPSGHNLVTNNPSPTPPNGHPASTINQRNFAGHNTAENYSTKSKLSSLIELKKGPTPPGGPSLVTNNPSPAPPNGHHASTINEKNFAGHTTIENYSTKSKLSGLTEPKLKGPTPSGGHNPVTNNPSPAPPNGHPASTINQRNFAGHTTTENYSTKSKLSGLIESKKGPTPPRGPSLVTNNPSPAPPNGHPASTINQRNFAGHTTTENYSTKSKLSGLTEPKLKGPTPPGGPNGRTNKPGPAPPTSGHAASTINQRNFAGDLLHMRTLTSGFHY